MTALNNSEYKQGWITGYYPYGQYMIIGEKVVFSGDEQMVNNSILTRKVVERSNSGFNGNVQSGGKDLKRFRLRGNRMGDAFKELERKVDRWVKSGKYKNNGLLVLSIESLEDGKIFVKIYEKKNM